MYETITQCRSNDDVNGASMKFLSVVSALIRYHQRLDSSTYFVIIALCIFDILYTTQIILFILCKDPHILK